MEDLIGLLLLSSGRNDYRRGDAVSAVAANISQGTGSNPQLWFTELKTQFELNRITTGSTTFPCCMLVLEYATQPSQYRL